MMYLKIKKKYPSKLKLEQKNKTFIPVIRGFFNLLFERTNPESINRVEQYKIRTGEAKKHGVFNRLRLGFLKE